MRFLERSMVSLNKVEKSKILYKNLESQLINMIEHSRYLPGQKFLSDRSISKKFGVSRSTANRAISDMVNQNLLYRVQGKGTFIPTDDHKHPNFSFSGSNSLTDALNKSGKKVSTKVLHLFENCTSRFFLEKLDLQSTDKVVGVQRKRFSDNVPFAIETTYVSSTLFPDFLSTDFNNVSLYDYMASMGHKPVAFQQYITAIVPDQRIKKILELEKDEFIFKINFTTADKTGRIVEYTESFMNLADMEMSYEVNFDSE